MTELHGTNVDTILVTVTRLFITIFPLHIVIRMGHSLFIGKPTSWQYYSLNPELSGIWSWSWQTCCANVERFLSILFFFNCNATLIYTIFFIVTCNQSYILFVWFLPFCWRDPGIPLLYCWFNPHLDCWIPTLVTPRCQTAKKRDEHPICIPGNEVVVSH